MSCQQSRFLTAVWNEQIHVFEPATRLHFGDVLYRDKEEALASRDVLYTGGDLFDEVRFFPFVSDQLLDARLP